MEPIREFQGKYRFLSNFWPATVSLLDDSSLYPSVETAYQAAKTTDVSKRTPFMYSSPGTSKRLGRKLKLREDWETVKLNVMLNLLRRKFAHPLLKQKLLSTGEAKLIEGNYWGDTFWGVCKGVGENNLGKLLMQVRKEFQEDQIVETC